MTPGTDAGTAENIINIEVLARFHFCSLMVIRMLSGTVWELILGAFWRLWAPFWWFGRVLGTGWNLDEFWGPSLEGPRLRLHTQVRVTGHTPGPRNRSQTPDC